MIRRSTQEASTSDSKPPPLELGWTTVQRKRRRVMDTAEDGEDQVCARWECNDPSCRDRGGALATAALSPPSSEETVTIHGSAVWLLHDMDSEWFQGYLFPSSDKPCSRPMGLLALIQPLDECLQCSEGGYRLIKLRVFLPSGSGNETKAKGMHELGEVEWTGGDMMRLDSSSVKMEPDKILVGVKAAAVAMQLFAGVWRKLHATYLDSYGENGPANVNLLDLLPDVAVVYGTMDLMMPEKDN